MIIDCISDLHGFYPELEGGDLLIVAGNLTATDKIFQYVDFFSWLKKQNYRKKILIAGNHDNFLQNGFPKSQKEADDLKEVKEFLESIEEENNPDFEYLCDSGIEFERLKIWGSPWTKTFPGMNPKCKAFTKDTEEELAIKFSLIPEDIDILITHSPPYGFLDKTKRQELVGSKSLLLKILEVKASLHVFGHIHEKGGKDMWLPLNNGIIFVNASHVNERYEPVNKPFRIIL